MIIVVWSTLSFTGCGEATAEEAPAVAPAEVTTAQAASTLVRNCPFNRAAMQLPIALQLELAKQPIGELPGGAQWRWVELQTQVESYVRTASALGATDLPLPRPGDYLASQPDLLTRADLMVHPDPLAPTTALLEASAALVEAYDADTRATITQAIDVLYAATGDSWPPKGGAAIWKESLLDLKSQLDGHPAQGKVTAMIDAVELFLGQTC